MAFELSKEQKERRYAIMSAIFAASVPASEFAQLNLFGGETELFIRREVERKLYEPQLPNGGFRERCWAERFEKLSRNEEMLQKMRGKAWEATQKWREIDGWYYTRLPLTPKGAKADWKWHKDELETARDQELWEEVWFHEMMLQGLPERIADFRIECLYLLRRADGNTDRMVRLRNVVNEKTRRPVTLPAEEFRAPEKFRGWCLNQGNFSWGGNQTHLQALHLDIARLTAWQTVNDVCSCGWMPLAVSREPGRVLMDGLWIYQDCIYTAAGKLLEATPAKEGEQVVYFHNGEGYRLNEIGRENKFHQKLPMMFPAFDLRTAPLNLASGASPHGNGQGPVHGNGQGPSTEIAVLRPFYREFCDRLQRTVGSLDAWLMVGSMLSYGAAPEIFEDRGEFTGMWVHGSRESGKSTTCGHLMEIHGLSLGRQGINLRGTNSTATGLAQALDQYGNIPVWADEFRFSEVGADKISVLHQTYNRGGQTKFNPSHVQRQTRTNFLVSGESTTDDAALRGRYMHIQMSADAREKSEGLTVPHEAWFNAHRMYFFTFFRFVLQRRPEFAELTMKLLTTWRQMPDISERTKLAFGIPYAAFVAMAHLLESHTPEELTAFRRHTVTAASGAAADVVSETNINVVWDHLITAFKAKEIPNSCFRVESKNLAYPPDAPNQEGWISYQLFMEVNGTLGALNQYLVKQRIPLMLNRKDLRDQLSKERSWIPGTINKRFGANSESLHCWGFKVDEHEMGYHQVPDEVAHHFLTNGNESDPRKGPLFAIVHAIEQDEKSKL